MEDTKNIDRLVNLGRETLELRDHPGGGKVMLVPVGFDVKTLENPDATPVVTRRKPTFFDTGSFIDYVNEYKIESQTRIFIAPNELKALAVIDYDKADEAAHGVHRASLQLSYSPQWSAWRAAEAHTKRTGFNQEEFAEFLEENNVEITKPTAAELIELVTKMQVTRTVSFKRSVNLHDGRVQFTYNNEDGGGSVEFPRRIELGIPVYRGGEYYKVEIIVRYRLQDGGGLRFGLIMHRADAILDDAIKGDIEAIKQKTGVPVYLGTAG